MAFLNRLITFLPILFFVSCFSQLDDQYKAEREKALDKFDRYNLLRLRGSVKKVELNTYDSFDMLIESTSYLFAKNGLLLEHKIHSKGRSALISKKYNNEYQSIFEERIEDGILVTREWCKDSIGKNKKIAKRDWYNKLNKLTHTITYTYNTYGQKSYVKLYDYESGSILSDQYTYQDSNLVQRKHLSYHNDSALEKKTINTYNLKGLETSCRRVFYSESDSTVDEDKTMFYDKSGNLIRTFTKLSFPNYSKESIISYSINGTKIDSISIYRSPSDINPDSIKARKKKYLFNTKGEIIKYESSEDKYSYDKEYSYNSEDFLSQEKTFFYKIGTTLIIKYDHLGIPISKVYFDSTGKIDSEKTIQLKYDHQRNYIEATIMENDSLKEIIRRTIEYY